MQTVSLPARSSKVGGLTKAQSCGFERLSSANATAREALAHAMARQLRNAFTRCYRWAADGTTFVLYYSDGWHYDIIGKAHAAAGCPCTCSAGPENGDHQTALECMERHVANYCPIGGGR